MGDHDELELVARAAGRAVPGDGDARGRIVLALRCAREAVPGVPLSAPRLGAAVRRHLRDEEELDAIAGWQLGDLHLAEAALEGVREAVGAVEHMLNEAAAPALARRNFSRAEIDEVVQDLMVKLLVGGGEGGARLSSYSGRGNLAGFLRSAAIRAALNVRRAEKRREARALEQHLETVLDDPAVRRLKEAYLESFRGALRAAWDSLEASHQLLLRHQFEDCLTVDEVARLQGVHRSTAARRLVAARDALSRATRRELQESLGLPDADLESVMMLIRSRLGDAADVLHGRDAPT